MADGSVVQAADFAVVFFVLIVILLLVRSARAIGPYQQGLVLQFGSYRGILNPGLHFVSPLAMVTRVDLRSQSVALRPQTLTTRDQRALSVEGELRFRVVDAPKAFFQTTDYRESLLQQAEQAAQAEVRSHELTALVSDPLAVNGRLAEAVGATTAVWGLKVESATVRFSEPSPGATPGPDRPLSTASAPSTRASDAPSSRRVGG